LLEKALSISRDLGERLCLANALTQLGAVRRETGDYAGAADALQEAQGIYRRMGIRNKMAEAFNETGTLHRALGDLSQARDCHQQALRLARQVDSVSDEARALAGLGRCALLDGRAAEAAANLRQAREIFQRIGAAEASIISGELDTLTRDYPDMLITESSGRAPMASSAIRLPCHRHHPQEAARNWTIRAEDRCRQWSAHSAGRLPSVLIQRYATIAAGTWPGSPNHERVCQAVHRSACRANGPE
jgi:tetratricopeptide (TPR) repeat protein